MSYRDDRDADRARIVALETELAAANTKIEELEGRQSTALVRAGGGTLARSGRPSSAKRWLGAPLGLELSSKIDGAFPSDKFEDLVEIIRRRTRDWGSVELNPASMSWWAMSSDRSTGPFTCIAVSVKDNVTTILATDRLHQLAGALFGGVGGGVGGGAFIAPVLASVAMPLLAPVFVLGWLGAVYAGTRALFKRAATKRARVLQQLFDVVEREIRRTLDSARDT